MSASIGSTSTTKLNLPFIAAGQAQKHVTHNEALERLDRLVQATVLSRTVATPPASPQKGDSYIIPANPTGVWSGKADQIAIFDGVVWQFEIIKSGWLSAVIDTASLVLRTSNGWEQLAKTGPVDKIGINATADLTTRLALSSPASLFSHAGSSHRLSINRQASTDTASIVFNDNFQGKAEVGLTGGSALQMRVSTNGTNWMTALSLDPIGGNVGIGIDQATIGFAGRTLHIHAATAADNWAVGHFTSGAASGASNGVIVGKIGAAGCLWNFDATPLYFGTSAQARMTISAFGFIGIGTTTPSVALDVSGLIRPASSTVAALPAASAGNAGAIVFVSNEQGGPVIAFSDGANWRRVTDRAIVS